MTKPTSPMTAAEIREAVGRVAWFHRIDLGHGIVTPGRDDSPRKLAEIGMPLDLTGHHVLDIGAYDGFFSFEAERRGASRVLAVDNWGGEECSPKEGFEVARRALASSVLDRTASVYDLTPDEVGVFDLVLFMGVLYHLRHPLLGLDRVAAVCRGLCILETHVDLLDHRRAAAAFYPGAELGRDATNWWGPNEAALFGMLRAAGFSRVDVVHRSPRESSLHRLGRAVYNAVRKGAPLRDTQRWGRIVVHARR